MIFVGGVSTIMCTYLAPRSVRRHGTMRAEPRMAEGQHRIKVSQTAVGCDRFICSRTFANLSLSQTLQHATRFVDTSTVPTARVQYGQGGGNAAQLSQASHQARRCTTSGCCSLTLGSCRIIICCVRSLTSRSRITMSVRERLIGTWECLFWTATNTNDPTDVMHPYGEDIKGTLIYTADGYMMSMLQKTGIPAFTPGPLVGTTEQYVEAASGTHGYHGEYFLEEEEGQPPKLYHQVLMGLPANWHGDTQERMFELKEEDGRLYLTIWTRFNIDVGGVERAVKLGFRKKDPNTRSSHPNKC